MNWLPPIATSDFNILIGVVATIGWVVMQIMGKAAKNKPPAGGDRPEAPDNPAPAGDAAEELRRFFQRLEGAQAPGAAPPNVPAEAGPDRGRRTTAASQSVTASGQAVTSSSQRTAARRSLEPQAPVLAPVAEVAPAGTAACPEPAALPAAAIVTAGALAEDRAHAGRCDFARRLRCTSDLRRAVAMMEVLSPPLGMRRTPFPIG